MPRIIAYPVAFLLIAIVIVSPFLGFSFVLPGHNGQWFSWIRKPNFEQLFVNCANDDWLSQYIEIRTSAAPRIQNRAEQETDLRQLRYKEKLEREAVKKKHELERRILNEKYESKADGRKQSQKSWEEILAENPELQKTINASKDLLKKFDEDRLAYPMGQYRKYLAVTEKLKNIDNYHMYCEYLINTGRADYKFTDQSYFGSRLSKIHNFSKGPKTENISSSHKSAETSINEYFKAFKGKSTFRKYILGETREYWADVLSKARKRLSEKDK